MPGPKLNEEDEQTVTLAKWLLGRGAIPVDRDRQKKAVRAVLDEFARICSEVGLAAVWSNSKEYLFVRELDNSVPQAEIYFEGSRFVVIATKRQSVQAEGGAPIGQAIDFDVTYNAFGDVFEGTEPERFIAPRPGEVIPMRSPLVALAEAVAKAMKAATDAR